MMEAKVRAVAAAEEAAAAVAAAEATAAARNRRRNRYGGNPGSQARSLLQNGSRPQVTTSNTVTSLTTDAQVSLKAHGNQ
jgi:hypothetical protein